jgi:8-oxo-dGTP pyrophosphatase MutT (NUDIX family)
MQVKEENCTFFSNHVSLRIECQMPRQIAALPLCFSPTGGLEVFLVTSRGSGRWIIPKGNPIKGLSPMDVAAQEAFEEAGLVGRVLPSCVGCFEFERLRRTTGKPSLIDVYPLFVEKQARRWDEKRQRTVLRCDVASAISLVCTPSLAQLIETYSDQLSSETILPPS